MSFTIEISTREIDPYDDNGEWMDGDTREIDSGDTNIEAYDEYDLDIYGPPVEWAVSRIGETDATECSDYPIPPSLRDGAWLSGCYNNPYTTAQTETTVRVTGDFTDEQRSEIFRRATTFN